jgi:trimeric autotransporter adhesin
MKRDSKPWLLVICSIAVCSLAWTNPSDPTIVQGNASFDNSDATTLIVTASEKAHIYWEDFSIAEGEVTQIVQPSSDSEIVIQVDSDLSSSILGTLQANGHVYLMNPNGVVIGVNGCIESNAFLATTFSGCACTLLEEQDDVFFQGESTAAIVNNGRIKALKKDLFLISYQIENKGAIDAAEGSVAIAAGHDVILRRLETQELDILPLNFKDENEDTGIDNSGMITACKVEFQADGNAYSVAIRHAGLISSLGIEGQNSEVNLIAEKGNSGIFGTISSENADGTGGVIQILGENIAFFESSNIDASGDTGGGLVFISGSANPNALMAKTIFVDEDVVISADAIKNGNGGKVIVRAEEMASFWGTVSACGGDDSGDGGYIEIFSNEKLDFKGEIDRTAPNGKMGILQLGSKR